MSRYAVMVFDTEINLGVSCNPNRWVNIENHYTNDGVIAITKMWRAIDTGRRAELVTAGDDYELHCKMGEMSEKYRDEQWLADSYSN